MQTLSRTVSYEVRFICYQYNCGGTMTNGNHASCKRFRDVDQAKAFAERVKSFARKGDGSIPEGSNRFASDFVHDGFVERHVGIYRITEEQVG